MFPDVHAHQPPDYDCPFCRLARGEATSVTDQRDVIHRDDEVMAFMSSAWWPNNRGHVLVVPIAHIENIYSMPDDLGAPLLRLTRRVASALREVYGCDGTSTRQHNEPAGNQDVWHIHIHVFPRYHGDDLYRTPRGPSDPGLRQAMAADLRAWLDRHP